MNAPAFSVSFFFLLAKRPRKVDNIFDIFPLSGNKYALINAGVSWVVYTNLLLTRKNALIIPVVSWVVYT